MREFVRNLSEWRPPQHVVLNSYRIVKNEPMVPLSGLILFVAGLVCALGVAVVLYHVAKFI